MKEHEQAAVGFLQRVAEAAVADPPAVGEQVLELGVAALAGGVGNEAVDPDRAMASLQRVKAIADVRSEKESQPIQQARRGRDFVDILAVMPKL